jgi:hypothetical protein
LPILLTIAIIGGAMLGSFMVIKEPIDKKIKNDINSNVKHGTITAVSFSDETGDLLESVTLRKDTQESQYCSGTISAAIETMEVAEKYPKIKYVTIDVATSNPDIPKTAHIESRTGKNINWATQSPSSDVAAYSRSVFDVVTWYINPNN